jgi:hypothetical protein
MGGKAMKRIVLAFALFAIAPGAFAAPRHWYRDWRWWTGTGVIALSVALDAHSTCRGFERGYVEGSRLLSGTRSCGATAGVAAGSFLFYTGMHALAWHCESDTSAPFRCHGLNQDDSKYRKYLQTLTYVAIPATAASFHLPAAAHNYSLR